MGKVVRILCGRVLPAIIITLAIILGWFMQQEQPMGSFFATAIPLMQGHLPPTIVGHGKMVGTPEVPADLKPQARPANEVLLPLPTIDSATMTNDAVSNNFTIPQVGLGMCCRYSAYDDVLVRRTVLWFLLQGGRHIDGAHLYLNHRAIGLGIADAMARGVPRKEIFVTTKIFPSHYGYDSTMATVPTYLEELGLEYIDLVLMHYPVSFPLQSNDCSKRGISKKECRAETWTALSELSNKGMIRNVGVSNFVIHHLEEFKAMPNVAPISVNQFQYNPWAPDFIQETYDYCQKHGIQVTAYASLGGSLQHAEATTVQTLNDIATAHGKSLAQIMLRWAIQSNCVVIPGTGNPKHMVENLQAYSFKLTHAEMEAIHQLRHDANAKKFFYMAPPKD